MRLLVVSHSYVLANTRGKLRALSRRADVTLLVPREWEFDLLRASAQAETASNIRLRASPTVLAGRIIRYLYAPHVLWTALTEFRPDAVLVEEEPNSLALAQFSLLKRCFAFRLLFFTWENIAWHPRLTSLIERLNLSAADAAVCGNLEAVEVLRRKGFSKPSTVIPQMGIDPQVFAPGRPQTAPVFVIGYVGRIVRQKGLLVLWDAVSCLSGEWRLQIVGNGPLRSELEARSIQAGWDKRVNWGEYVPREQLPSFFGGVDVVVLPSLTGERWKEQFGRVLIEAMACGVPVIGSDSGAIPEVIADAGIIVPEGDARALCDALTLLMDDRSLRRELSERARRRALANFSDDVLGQRLCQFVAKQIRQS